MANENIIASSKAETKAVTAEQRISSSEAIVANRVDVKMFKAHKKSLEKPAKKTSKKRIKKATKTPKTVEKQA
ncbi:MAG: hypothetical protein MJ219_01615 [Mycoplasmoidaceae bacterium]|nr:hypothetical protein [Mycoplasmoidaceae bacterium]